MPLYWCTSAVIGFLKCQKHAGTCVSGGATRSSLSLVNLSHAISLSHPLSSLSAECLQVRPVRLLLLNRGTRLKYTPSLRYLHRLRLLRRPHPQQVVLRPNSTRIRKREVAMGNGHCRPVMLAHISWPCRRREIRCLC